jgi:subfamily B ATP-binding cassette protein MsbA
MNNMSENKSYYLRLLSYVSPYLGFFILSIFGFIIFAFSQVAIAEWFKQIVDFVADPDPKQTLILPIALVVLAFIRGIGFYLGNFFMAYVSTKLIHDLRSDLFKTLIALPSKFYDSNNSGHLLSRITFNVGLVKDAGTEAIKIILREGLIVIGLFGYLLYLNWKLSIVLLLTGPFIAAIVYFAGKRLRRISTRLQNAMGDITHVSSESINANKEIKLFGQQETEFSKFVKASNDNVNANLKLESTNSIASPLIQIILSLSLATITWFALDSDVIEVMSSGTFIAFFGAAAMLAKPIRQLSQTNAMIQRGLAASEVIFDQIDEKPEENGGKEIIKNSEGKLEFKNVSFTYENSEIQTLSNISFQVDKGKTLAIVGSSGAGKSSLINLIPRFYEVTDGEILLDGLPINELEISSLRSEISAVGQTTVLFNDTIFNNIKYANPNATEQEIIEASKKAHADDFITNLPEGYETKVGDDGSLLSGGQRQRIAVARAFLKSCSILILDEATSALDSESEKLVQEAIDELKKGKTTIVIAHRLATVENADEIVVIKSGEIIERGVHEKLLAEESEYFDLYKNQFSDKTIKKSENKQIIIPQAKIEETPPKGIIQTAWYENHLWIKLLSPVSFVFNIIASLRRKNLQKISWKPKQKIIVVGNLTVGGNGKTPFVIWLAKLLRKKGMKPGVISRGYKSNAVKFPLEVNHQTSVSASGDEPKLIFNSTNCPVVISPDRVEAAQFLLKKHNCDVIISDDGMQHYKLGRDMEIALVDGYKKFGNGFTLPAGPLREPVKRLKEVDYIISANKSWIEEKETSNKDKLMTYEPVAWVDLKTGIEKPISEWPLDKLVYAVAGIANPQNFFSTLRSLGFEVIENIFPDHYEYNKADFSRLTDLPVLMTEKDAIKCKNISGNFWYLKIEAKLPDDFAEEIYTKIIS